MRRFAVLIRHNNGEQKMKYAINREYQADTFVVQFGELTKEQAKELMLLFAVMQKKETPK